MKQFSGLMRRAAVLFSIPALLLAGCDDATRPEPTTGREAAVIVNSTERSLTVVPVDDPAGQFTIGVSAEGSPVGVAARGNVAVVPLGTYPFAAVVDLQARSVTHMVALPEGSGATGVAFLNDSIALVANPGLNSVSPVNVRRGTAGAQIPTGVYPSSIIAHDGRAYVLNGELENWSPARPGTITVIDASLQPAGTIQLTGLNPGAAAVGGNGRLYVINSGNWGDGNGSLSVVNTSTLQEVSHHPGFGNFPGSIAVDPSGSVLVGVYGTGILSWNPATGSLTRGLDDPIRPGLTPPVADLGFDSQGRLYTLYPGQCDAPGLAYRIAAGGQVEQEITTGICPFGLAFALLPED